MCTALVVWVFSEHFTFKRCIVAIQNHLNLKSPNIFDSRVSN